MKFGTAGIRALVSDKFNENTMDKFAAALSRISNNIVVGHDGRVHSESLAKALIAGLQREGVDVFFLGLAPTPVVAFAVRLLNADFGISITASHNPPEYNGLKIIGKGGIDLYRDEEKKIENLVNSKITRKYCYNGRIINVSEIVREEYIEYVLRFIERNFRIEHRRILFDPANGVTAIYTPLILSEIGHEVITVNSHIDGRFPGRIPEPSEENISKYVKIMETLKADMYVGQDGDGDRIAVGLENKYVLEDYVTATFIYLARRKFSGSKVILSPNISPHVYQYAESLGLRTEMRPLGYLHEGLSDDTLIASEPWKIMIKDFGPWFDGIMASAILSVNISALREIFNVLPKLYKKTVNIRLSDMRFARELIHDIVKHLKKIENVNVREEPWGTRVLSKEWWVLVRPSGTEPKVRAYVESISKDAFRKVLNILEGVVAKWR
ncbi:MAG: hypothetical protein J7K58_05710 [Euryarchaeota archaeon]|nr:hypothetical protein [Euryarchaeota archaeon]